MVVIELTADEKNILEQALWLYADEQHGDNEDINDKNCPCWPVDDLRYKIEGLKEV